MSPKSLLFGMVTICVATIAGSIGVAKHAKVPESTWAKVASVLSKDGGLLARASDASEKNSLRKKTTKSSQEGA